LFFGLEDKSDPARRELLGPNIQLSMCNQIQLIVLASCHSGVP
jgi:hypothetical protein